MSLRKQKIIIKSKLIFLKNRLQGGGGTAGPGQYAKSSDPEFMKKYASDIHSIFVIGTNGKTTTTHMITQLLTDAGIPCFSNREGANMDIGIWTSYIKNFNIWGSSKKKYAVIECDEKYYPLVYKDFKPEITVVTNIYEDQTDRLGSPDDVFEMIVRTLSQGTETICLNRLSPYYDRFVKRLPERKIISYEADESTINVDDHTYDIEGFLECNWMNEDAAAACSALTALGKISSSTLNSLRKFKAPFGRMEHIKIGNSDSCLVLVKNVKSAAVTLEHIKKQKEPCLLVFGFNAKSFDGKDRTWINRIDLSGYDDILSDVIISGECAKETENWLTGISTSLIYEPDQEGLIKLISKCDKPVYLLLNYTFLMSFREFLAKKHYTKHFWQF